MTRAIDQAIKDTYQLVKLSFAAGSATYTDWTSDVVGDEGLTYVSTPSLEIQLPVNNGILNNDDSASCQLRMPMDDFLRTLSCGLPFAPVSITVKEFIKPLTGGPEASNHITFRGRLVRTIRNPQGRSGEVTLQGMSAKGRLNIPLGVPCNPQCENTLGDPRCKVVVPWSGGLITNIDGKELTITGVSVTAFVRYWQRGYISYQGLNLMIRDWDFPDPTHFYMTRQAPNSWLSANVVVVAGCDKSFGTCHAKYNNQSNFNGLGAAIPAYHPVLEGGDV